MESDEYKRLISCWLKGKNGVNKDSFDKELRKILPSPEQRREHNKFMLNLLVHAATAAKRPENLPIASDGRQVLREKSSSSRVSGKRSSFKSPESVGGKRSKGNVLSDTRKSDAAQKAYEKMSKKSQTGFQPLDQMVVDVRNAAPPSELSGIESSSSRSKQSSPSDVLVQSSSSSGRPVELQNSNLLARLHTLLEPRRTRIQPEAAKTLEDQINDKIQLYLKQQLGKS